MTKSTTTNIPHTSDQILDIAEHLIQTRGYSAFSYQDVAVALDIRKASIHYHFRSKSDLGIAVVDRYAAKFSAALATIAHDPSKSSMAILDHYISPYMEFAKSTDKVCLCGALAGEMMALPPEIRLRVEAFFIEHHAWLASILKRGVDRGEFHLSAKPGKMARLVFGALQGALLVKRTTGDASQLKDVVDALKAQITEGTKF
ncbi:MAG: TetR/AcrR family transcriptional regulator [Hyphomicrobium sp.]|nr:TetR/AcrR family transcriptional regulator [Hyphomicrobium sp.]